MVFYDGKAISVELPTSVVREITWTEPAVKGDTSGKVMKPAKIATGFEVPVPLFVDQGDKIEIDTRCHALRSGNQTLFPIERCAMNASSGRSLHLPASRRILDLASAQQAAGHAALHHHTHLGRWALTHHVIKRVLVVNLHLARIDPEIGLRAWRASGVLPSAVMRGPPSNCRTRRCSANSSG